MRKYPQPNYMTPTYVVLFDPKNYIAEGIDKYVFATQAEAEYFWFTKSGRMKKEAHIVKRRFTNKAELMRDINNIIIQGGKA